MVGSITEAGTINMRSLASAASPSHDGALIFNPDTVAAALIKPLEISFRNKTINAAQYINSF